MVALAQQRNEIGEMKSPAFRFYPSDFITGTDHMSSDQVGLYMRLLCYSWLVGGLPDDEVQLSRLGRWEKQSEFPELVRRKFVKCEDGLLRNVRLEEERDKQEKHSAIQRSNVIEGRWKKKTTDNGKLTTAERIALEKQTEEQKARLKTLEHNRPYVSSAPEYAQMKALRSDIAKANAVLKINLP